MDILFIFLIALVIGFIMSIPVGPVGVITIKRTLEYGKWYGFFAGIGSVFSEIIFASIVAFNIHYLSHFIYHYRVVIQVIGIIILTIIALRMFFSQRISLQEGNDREKRLHVISDFFHTFFINLTNPAVIITFIVFLGIFHIDHHLDSIFKQWAFVIGDFFGSLLWFLTLSNIVAHLHKKIEKDIIPFVYRASGSLLFIFIFLFISEAVWEVFLH